MQPVVFHRKGIDLQRQRRLHFLVDDCELSAALQGGISRGEYGKVVDRLFALKKAPCAALILGDKKARAYACEGSAPFFFIQDQGRKLFFVFFDA